MTDTLSLIARMYLAIGVIFAVWLIVMAGYQLDRFDRQNLNKGAAAGILLLCILAWPIAMIHRPKALVSVRALAPIDYRSAAFMRERYRLSQALPHCSSRVCFSPTKEGVKMASHLFSPAEIESTAAKPIKRYWLSQDEETQIIRWVRSSDLNDATPVDVPWIWTGFIHLADEMLRQGLGKTHCAQCDKAYSATELRSDNDSSAGDSNQKRLLCPAGHTVLELQRKQPPALN